jgi:hypothetical protein
MRCHLAVVSGSLNTDIGVGTNAEIINKATDEKIVMAKLCLKSRFRLLMPFGEDHRHIKSYVILKLALD